MTFYRGGARRRRDQIEPHIVTALRARGAQTWQVGGRGLPDLLVWYRNRPIVLEIKSGNAPLSPVQAHDRAPWPVVRSVEEAVAAVCSEFSD